MIGDRAPIVGSALMRPRQPRSPSSPGKLDNPCRMRSGRSDVRGRPGPPARPRASILSKPALASRFRARSVGCPPWSSTTKPACFMRVPTCLSTVTRKGVNAKVEPGPRAGPSTPILPPVHLHDALDRSREPRCPVAALLAAVPRTCRGPAGTFARNLGRGRISGDVRGRCIAATRRIVKESVGSAEAPATATPRPISVELDRIADQNLSRTCAMRPLVAVGRAGRFGGQPRDFKAICFAAASGSNGAVSTVLPPHRRSNSRSMKSVEPARPRSSTDRGPSLMRAEQMAAIGLQHRSSTARAS